MNEFEGSEAAEYAVERYGKGFIVADYSGKRGRLGAAYAGRDGVWHDQPISVGEPFASEDAARQWADTQRKE